mgnify:CR=1 FL=1
MRTETEHTIYLKDYAPSPYRISHVDLDFRIGSETTRVRALLTVEPREGTAAGTPLVLDGDELALSSIAIDGAPLLLIGSSAGVLLPKAGPNELLEAVPRYGATVLRFEAFGPDLLGWRMDAADIPLRGIAHVRRDDAGAVSALVIDTTRTRGMRFVRQD